MSTFRSPFMMITLLQFALVLCVAATCVITAQAGINDTPKTDADVTKNMDVANQWVSARGGRTYC